MHAFILHSYILKFKEFKNLSVEKKTFSNAPGFEPGYFDCRSTACTFV